MLCNGLQLPLIDEQCEPYCPTTDCVTIYFLKDLVMARKKKILGKDVRHIAVPQYEGLSIQKMSEFVSSYPSVDDYLPIAKEIPKLPKQWIATVFHTVLKNIFSDWERGLEAP